ncbi:MAG: hypothetical protein C0483_18270 [Pirellula sp.]|nr:hypothetical protein [Pirellula sp.]
MERGPTSTRHNPCLRYSFRFLPESHPVQSRPLTFRRSTTQLAWRLIVSALIGCGATATTEVARAADDSLTVTVRSGRTFYGVLDAKTDPQRLWISSGRDGVRIERPIVWSSIRGISRSGVAVAGESLIAEAERLRASQNAAEPSYVTKVPPAAPAANRAAGLQLWHVAKEPVEYAMAPDETVRWIEIDAYLANWDADVEADGLVLDLEALNASGETIPADGTLTIELFGERLPPLSRGNAFPMLANWTRQVTAADFGRGTIRLRLDFQGVHPDFNTVAGRFALAHVRFSVPGQGTFEASKDGLTLQGFSPVRERVQQAFGTRFLPTETTGRGHRESAFDAR